MWDHHASSYKCHHFSRAKARLNTGGMHSRFAVENHLSGTYLTHSSLPFHTHARPSQVFTSNQMVDEQQAELLHEVWLSPQGDCLQANLKPPELQSEINACHLFLFLAENGERTTASFCEAAEPCVWNVLVHYFLVTCDSCFLSRRFFSPSFSPLLPSTNVCCLRKTLLSIPDT